jgi:hypothetical protein
MFYNGKKFGRIHSYFTPNTMGWMHDLFTVDYIFRVSRTTLCSIKFIKSYSLYDYIFRPMRSSSGVKIIGPGKCCLLLLLMLLIYKSSRCALGCNLSIFVLSCEDTHALRGDFATQHKKGENTTHQLKHACASRGLRSTTHNRRKYNPPTQNTRAHRGDFVAQHKTGENTTHQLKYACVSRGLRSTTHNRREYNPPTQTHIRSEGTYATTEDSNFVAQ